MKVAASRFWVSWRRCSPFSSRAGIVDDIGTVDYIETVDDIVTAVDERNLTRS